jgi:hypothetical protein
MRPVLRRLSGGTDQTRAAAVEQRLGQLEQLATQLAEDVNVLWALCPVWIRAALPHAKESGWTIRRETSWLVFEHPERETYRIALPLPVDPADQVGTQRELHMRLGFVGKSGLEGRKRPRVERPRIMDLP